jgi:sentrin-specific protease 1
MRAFRAAKASREAPRPAVVPLETFAGLKLRDTKLDKELERRAQPRRRFPGSLDAEKEARVRQIMANASFVSTMPGAEVTNRDIRKLGPSSWLNDEVINFYAVMINMCAAGPSF